MPEVSIVIPAYNEERRLAATLAGWLGFLDGERLDGEVVVADDGSTDGTREITATAARDPRVRLVALPANRGKGAAVRGGMLAARGRYLLCVDADLNIAPSHVPAFLARLREDADLVIARRSLAEYASEERSAARIVAGASVQTLRRLLMLTWVTDTQAGFKAYRREPARRIFTQTRIDSFAYDIEVLYLARRLGARLAELPVQVVYRPDSTYSPRKHLPRFLTDIAAIRVNALRGRYRT